MPARIEQETDPCIVCNAEQAAPANAGDFDGIAQACPRCGEFKIVGTVLAILGHGLGTKKRAKLSGWVADQNRVGAVPVITSDIIRNIVARPLPSVAERAQRLLIEAGRGQTLLGEGFNIFKPRFIAATYSQDVNEVGFLLKLLREQGWAELTAQGGSAEILPQGYIELDSLKQHTSESTQGFVAMWFDDSLDLAYSDGFQKGVLEAGYDPVRIDQVEHVNRIDDEIIAQINASRFVVADFTGHRGGVYFEAGYALGLGQPVFWTCHKDHIADLHFDIRQFNCIDWEGPKDLANRLSKRIEAVLGAGPAKMDLGGPV